MFTESQHTEIRNYLLSKKLPIDILLEVNDHFVSQISDLQREEKLSFEEVFKKTKLSWEKELKPYWKGGLNLEDVSDFMRKMRKQIELENLKFALQWSVIPLILIFGAAQIFNAQTFVYFSLTVIGILVLYTIFSYLQHYQEFKLVKKYSNHVLTLHQHSIFIFIIILSPVINVYRKLLEDPEQYQKIILFQSGNSEVSDFAFIFLSFYLISFAVFLSLSAQKNYLKQIRKVKPFLKYL